MLCPPDGRGFLTASKLSMLMNPLVHSELALETSAHVYVHVIKNRVTCITGLVLPPLRIKQ